MYSRKSNGSHVRGSKFYTELYRSHVLGDLGKNSFLSLGLFLLVFKGRVLKDQNHYISSCSNSVNERLPLRQTATDVLASTLENGYSPSPASYLQPPFSAAISYRDLPPCLWTTASILSGHSVAAPPCARQMCMDLQNTWPLIVVLPQEWLEKQLVFLRKTVQFHAAVGADMDSWPGPFS